MLFVQKLQMLDKYLHFDGKTSKFESKMKMTVEIWVNFKCL